MLQSEVKGRMSNPFHVLPVPAVKQFTIRVSKESSDVRTAEGHPGHAEGETHGDAGLEVAPFCGVVSSPDGCIPLGPSKGGPRAQQTEVFTCT